jgi:hypothetical protein
LLSLSGIQPDLTDDAIDRLAQHAVIPPQLTPPHATRHEFTERLNDKIIHDQPPIRSP